MGCWKYYSPEFECDALNFELLSSSPWSGHRAFAYDYVRNVRPGTIVELGSYYGCSSFAFLQAVKDGAAGPSFYAVDTWKGDAYTEGDYREDVYGAFMSVLESCYGGTDAHVLRTDFDSAADSFADGSIDLLHIDGSHDYEEVRHDFETWRGKVAEGGAIFFHDIGEDRLLGREMGPKRLWEEIKAEYPYTVEFPFSFGLGVLVFDGGLQ